MRSFSSVARAVRLDLLLLSRPTAYIILSEQQSLESESHSWYILCACNRMYVSGLGCDYTYEYGALPSWHTSVQSRKIWASKHRYLSYYVMFVMPMLIYCSYTSLWVNNWLMFCEDFLSSNMCMCYVLMSRIMYLRETLLYTQKLAILLRNIGDSCLCGLAHFNSMLLRLKRAQTFKLRHSFSTRLASTWVYVL